MGGAVLGVHGIILCVSAQAAIDLTTGLVAYFPFNGNANDASGNGNNGTIVGASYSSDRFGEGAKALHFSPDPASMFTVPGGFIPSGYAPMTIAFWMQIENPTLPPVGFTKYPVFGGTLDQFNMWNFNFIFQGNGVDFTPNIERFDDAGFRGAFSHWSLFTNYSSALLWDGHRQKPQ